jgi:hypothetical protein
VRINQTLDIMLSIVARWVEHFEHPKTRTPVRYSLYLRPISAQKMGGEGYVVVFDCNQDGMRSRVQAGWRGAGLFQFIGGLLPLWDTTAIYRAREYV